MGKGINSHKQIPKGLIKPFSVSGKVYCYDLKENKIKSSDCGINTEQGYYSPELEQCMNDNFEKKFFDIRNRIEIDNAISLTPEDIVTIRDFYKLSASRGNRVVNIFRKCNPNNANAESDSSIQKKIIKSQMPTKAEFDEIFSDMTPVIFINKTERNFVTIKNCFFSVHLHRIEFLVIALSPKTIVSLVDDKKYNEYYKEFSTRCININDDESINHVNEYALRDEIRYNNDFIISKTEEELYHLKNYYDSNKEELQALTLL